MKKRFPALTLLLTLLLCVAVRAAEPRLEVRPPAAPVGAGQEFAVTVDLTGNPGVQTIQFALAFDHSLMECVAAEVGDITRKADIRIAEADTPSGAAIAAASMQPVTGDGTVGLFRFKAKESLSNFHFSMENISISDRNGKELDVVVSVGGGGENQIGSASNGGKPADNGGASNGSKPADSGSASNGSKTNNNGNTSSGSGAANNGGASNGSGSDSGSASGGSKPADSGSASPLFSDIAGTWAEEYITAAAERNLFQGYADGTFRPDSRLTRAQFMMVLWNLAGRPAPSAQSPFKDMGAQIENFQKAVSWAYGKGYVNGTSPDTFSPGAPLTRQAAVKILFAYNGSRRGAEALLTAVYDEQYADSGKISSWAKNAMYWAVYQTILSGTSPTTLNPGGTVTRAQLAAIMVRYAGRFPAA